MKAASFALAGPLTVALYKSICPQRSDKGIYIIILKVTLRKLNFWINNTSKY